MANFTDFGKNLPKHELMRSLLTDLNKFGHTASRKSLSKTRYRTRSTQTKEYSGHCDLDRHPGKEDRWKCYCDKSRQAPSDRGDAKGNFVKAQVEKLDAKIKCLQYNPAYQTQNFVDLMASIRQRLDKQVESISNCESVSDWNDYPTSLDHLVRFPKETKNAMSLLLDKRSVTYNPNTRYNLTSNGPWPGVAERVGEPQVYCRSGQR